MAHLRAQLTLGDEVVFTYDAQESMAELVRQGRPGPVAHDLAFGDGLAPKPGEAKAGTDEVTVERDGAEWVMRLYGDEVARCSGDRISSRTRPRVGRRWPRARGGVMTVLHRLAADPAWVVDPDTPGSFARYANRFNVTDSYGTRFLPGSWYAGGLDPDRVYPLLDMHQAVSARDVLGGFQAREDDAGLWIAGTFARRRPPGRGSWPGWDSPPASRGFRA